MTMTKVSSRKLRAGSSSSISTLHTLCSSIFGIDYTPDLYKHRKAIGQSRDASGQSDILQWYTFLFELFQWRLYCSFLVLQLTHLNALSMSQKPYSNTRFLLPLHLIAPLIPRFAVRWTQMHILMHTSRFNKGNGPTRQPSHPISPSPRHLKA